MATNTYVALHTNTVTGSAVANYTYSSIPATYTDLVCVIEGTVSSIDDIAIQFNGDTATNYSLTMMYGNGSSTVSGRTTSQSSMTIGGLSTVRSSTILHIMDYANTTTYKTVLARADASDWVTFAKVGLWRKTPEAINSIKFIHSGNFAVGTTFNIYGIKAESVSPTPKATGGTIYSDSTYYYHAFGATGTFTPLASLSADILVVAGGGGGGRIVAGGGGAGGLLAFTGQSLSATGYTCTVGAGGSGSTSGSYTSGTVGGDSQFGALTLVKGGGAGGAISTAGGNGGSGGGGGGGGSGTTNAGGSPTSGQGYAGGTSTGNTITYIGAGGGGAGGAGGVNTTVKAGDGGVGSSTYSSWGVATGVGQNVSGTYYLAGGGGGGWSSTPNQPQSIGLGGFGGGGYGGYSYAGVDVVGLAGTPNTGGGGGGAGNDVTGANVNSYGKNGGSGVIIIRYAKV